MPKVSKVFDGKPKTGFSVFSEKPKATRVFDEKPNVADILGEIPSYIITDRVLRAGQYMGLPFLLTYPTAGTVEIIS